MGKTKRHATIRLSEELYNIIQSKADQVGASFSSMARMLIEAGLTVDTMDSENGLVIPSASSLPVRDSSITEAIMVLAQALNREEEISNILGTDIKSFPKEEIREKKAEKKAAPAASSKPTPAVSPKKVEVPKEKSIESPKIVEDQPKISEEIIEETPAKPLKEEIAEIPKEPVKETPKAPAPIATPVKPVEETSEAAGEDTDNEIDYSESTDANFSDDFMSNLDSILGLG